MSENRSCIVVDTHPVVRLGLIRALADDWQCDDVGDVDAAVEMIRSYGGYDAAIVGLRRASGQSRASTEAIRRLRGAAPGVGIVARGLHTDRHTADAAIAAGAMGYVGPLCDPETIRVAVLAASEGNRFVDPDASASAGTKRTLTRRQVEVLQHLADGASTEQVAKRLGLSEQTVRTHAKGILARLDAHGRAHAVALAIRAGLID